MWRFSRFSKIRSHTHNSLRRQMTCHNHRSEYTGSYIGNKIWRQKSTTNSIHHLHRSLKEFIKVLIVVTSWLDKQYKCMESYGKLMMCHILFKLMVWLKYMVDVNFMNNNRKMIQCHTLSCLLDYEKYLVLWWGQLKTKAKWLIAVVLCTISS